MRIQSSTLSQASFYPLQQGGVEAKLPAAAPKANAAPAPAAPAAPANAKADADGSQIFWLAAAILGPLILAFLAAPRRDAPKLAVIGMIAGGLTASIVGYAISSAILAVGGFGLAAFLLLLLPLAF